MFSEVVNSFCTNRFSKLDCRTLKDGADTNTQDEEFFRIEKNSTFKEKKRQDRQFYKRKLRRQLGVATPVCRWHFELHKKTKERQHH